MTRPHPLDVLRASAGAASAQTLNDLCGRRALMRAVEAGDVLRTRRGRYALPAIGPALLAAERHAAVVSHTSAALLLGLDVAFKPDRHHLTVPRHRHTAIPNAVTHWADLGRGEVDRGRTSPLRTVLDCARALPFREALVVADSALRKTLVTPDELRSVEAAARGAGSARIRRVLRAADGWSGSALESMLRGLLIDAGIDGFFRQWVVRDDRFFAQVDLAAPLARIALEADSFAHHGQRKALAADCRRYDELVIRGWRVLRFAWEQVMFEPAWVLDTVRAALGLRTGARAELAESA